MKPQANLLTVDLEEWFVVDALAERIPFDQWDVQESTLESNCYRLIELFHRKQVVATWFVLGWCAERFPSLISMIADAGHEIACHSYRHRRVSSLTPEEFRKDTKKAIDVIEKAVGFRPIGYRSPSWSVNPSTGWAFEVLADLEFAYDSSIFPIKHDLYGIPDGPRHLFRMSFENGQTLQEMPASTYQFMGKNIPFGGGGYLRHSPYWYTKKVFNHLNRRGEPVVVYVHPWEFDPDPPHIQGLNALQRFRMYGSTDILESKLEKLLEDFEFTFMSDYIGIRTTDRIGFGRF